MMSWIHDCINPLINLSKSHYNYNNYVTMCVLYFFPLKCEHFNSHWVVSEHDFSHIALFTLHGRTQA